ncbi:MAG: hypothetical protein HY666_01555 [Chloroflexi bacterium]|nr:hypothetical protein [Chloroflexota bacterium]
MDLIFERGSVSQPKGHTLLYFRNSLDREEIWATYLVVLPITVDITKYVPPFLMAQVTDLGPKELSAFAFPPAPEKLEGSERLSSLAEIRDDDVLFGGTINPSDVTSLLMVVNESVQKYAQAYADYVESKAPSPESSIGIGVSEVLYSLMSEQDRLNELTKLVGKLRFALEGRDQHLVREAEEEFGLLNGYFPEGYEISKLLSAAKILGEKGAKLAELYVRRCYYLAQQEYEKVPQIDEEIVGLELSQ